MHFLTLERTIRKEILSMNARKNAFYKDDVSIYGRNGFGSRLKGRFSYFMKISHEQFHTFYDQIEGGIALITRETERLVFANKSLLKRAEYHVHISDMGVDECPLTDSEYKTEQPSGCFHLPSQQSSCCSRTEASSSIS